MYVTDAMIQEMAIRFGEPATESFRYKVSVEEFDRIGRSQKFRRNHDVTLYVRKDGKWLVIAKHLYPSGLFRSMSGGLEPGESFNDGIAREAREELGCRVDIRRFLLKTRVEFAKLDEVIVWRSFIFLADYRDGDLDYTDTHEIREVRHCAWADFDRYGAMMRRLPVGGLHYRAALHDAVKPLLTGEPGTE